MAENEYVEKSSIEVCRTCGGEGVCRIYNREILRSEDRVCKTCKGTGLVRVSRYVTVRAHTPHPESALSS